MKTLFKPFRFIAFAALTLIVASCARDTSDNVNQDSIYARYVLEYNANTDITVARVQFRMSGATGTILQLTAPATVSFNGDQLTWNNGLAYYSNEYAGLVTSGNFSYTDLDNNTFTNTASVPSSAEFPASLDTLKISSAYEMFWVGDPLGVDENIWVSVDGTGTTGSGQIFTTYTDGASSIIMGLNQLQNLGTGVADNIWMDRNIETDLQQGTSKGGVIVGRYKANTLQNIPVTN